MNLLSIAPAEGTLAYFPGETLTGEVGWTLDGPVHSAALRLCWQTSGRGRRDVGIIDTRTFADPQPADRRDFAFILPASPCSFTGSLITLTWSLELALNPGDHAQRLEIVLSPTGQPIILSAQAPAAPSRFPHR